MIIILKSGIGDAAIDDVCRRVTEMGYAPHIIRGEFKTIVAAVGEDRHHPDMECDHDRAHPQHQVTQEYETLGSNQRDSHREGKLAPEDLGPAYWKQAEHPEIAPFQR